MRIDDNLRVLGRHQQEERTSEGWIIVAEVTELAKQQGWKHRDCPDPHLVKAQWMFSEVADGIQKMDLRATY